MKTTALILTIFLSLFTAPKAMSANGDGSGNAPKSVIQSCMYQVNANGDGSGNNPYASTKANGDGSGNDPYASTKANGDGSGNDSGKNENRYATFLSCIKKY